MYKRQPFKQILKQIGNPEDKLENMKQNYAQMGLDCLVVLGGNGTHKTANLLSQNGLNVVTLPKTIDNDIWGTDMTFGFHSAMAVSYTHLLLTTLSSLSQNLIHNYSVIRSAVSSA